MVAILIALARLSVSGQNEPVIVELESAGTIGSDYAEGTDGDVTYLYPQTDFISTDFPGDATKVVSMSVTFADTGTYKLYARIRVGSDPGNDDSFFYGNGFGTKDPASGEDWNTCNQMGTAGYYLGEDVVMDQGGAPNQIWKWVALSDYTGGDPAVTFHVDQGSLTQIFEMGAREDGLDMDKIAFGKANLYYTVNNLDNGEAGLPYLPGNEPGVPLAYGLDKFLGCVYGGHSANDFVDYWNQVTPENGGKWGSAEPTRDAMNWGSLDAAYEVAMDSNLFYRHHVLVWGNQQPGWIAALDSAEQRAEIQEWFDAVAERYPGITQAEVVNEPLHDPPDDPEDGGYIGALGGSGLTGWDWVIEAFRMARTSFGSETNLMINEFNIMNSTSNTDEYREIIDLLVAEDTLIDGIGLQAHGFSQDASEAVVQRNLDTLAATGLPIYITEMDVDGPTDLIQVNRYMKYFPLFWEHPSVEGITLWGFRPGMWRTDQGAYLIDLQGEERPAMLWLRAYLKNEFVPDESISISTQSGESTIDTYQGSLQMIAEVLPDTATLQTVNWSVSNQNIATIDQDGVLSAVANGTVTVTGRSLEYQSSVQGTMDITITGQELSVESLADLGVTIFPNPVTEGTISLRGMEGIRQVSILDMNGRLISSRNTVNQSSIDLQLDVPSGMYLIRMQTANRIYHKKILIR